MSSGGSRSRTNQQTQTTTSSNSRVDSEINPFLRKQSRRQINRVNNILSRPEYTDPALYPGMGELREGALNERLSRILESGLEVPEAAVGEFAKTMRGEYLDPSTNPWLAEIGDRVAMDAERAALNRFGGSRFGSGAMANALADARTETLAGLYGNAYESERDRMANAVRFAPFLAGMENADAKEVEEIGAAFEQDDYERWRWPLDRESYRLAQLSGSPLTLERFVSGETESVSDALTSGRTRTKKDFDWAAFLGALL